MNDYTPSAPVRSRPQKQGMIQRMLGSLMVKGFKSPVFATLVLLIAGVVFASIMMASYPGEPEEGMQIPIVRADQTPYKVMPDPIDAQKKMPYGDSTIFAVMEDDANIAERKVENLLAPTPEVEKALEIADANVPMPFEPEEEPVNEEDTPQEPMAKSLANTSVETALDVEDAPEPKNMLPLAELNTIDVDVEKAKEEQAPETLDFVKSVLAQKDQKTTELIKPAAPKAKIESVPQATKPKAKPASTGTKTVEKTEPVREASSQSFKPVSGSSYVQLASVKDGARASGEWSNMQKKFPDLGATQYRVKRADLGDKGVYFRIQAGPMSTNSAKDLCGRIKAASGSCFVVK